MQILGTPRRYVGRRVAMALFLALSGPVAYAHDPEPTPTASKIAGLGSLSFPTSTHSPQAQAAFERGMLWLHLFEYPNAVTEFQNAERLDPDFAMAYWGEAMTHTHAVWNQDDADGALAALAKLGPTPEARAAKAGSAREKAYLSAAEQLFGAGTLKERDQRFLAAMAAMAKTWPDDDEAQLFHALALLGVTRGERDLPNYLQAAEISKQVYARNPQHPGAAHYWIHGMDDPAHAAGALEAARALSRIAPDAGHAQHMTAHIFMALGLWQDVVVANVAAIRVVDAETKAAQLPAYHCGHYIEWLQYSYYQQGRERQAKQLLADCARDGARAVAWLTDHPQASFRGIKTPSAMKKRWQESLVNMRAAAVAATSANEAAVALDIDRQVLGRDAGWDVFALGYAAATGGEASAAKDRLAELQAIEQQAPGEDEGPTESAYLHVLDRLLTAAIADREGRSDDALAAVREASAQYDALPFDYGPPVPVKPPHELAGELLLKAGRAGEALAEFDLSLKSAPRRALSMLGRARAFTASGDRDAARQVYAELLTMWQQADADLPALAEARAAVAAGQPTTEQAPITGSLPRRPLHRHPKKPPIRVIASADAHRANCRPGSLSRHVDVPATVRA